MNVRIGETVEVFDGDRKIWRAAVVVAVGTAMFFALETSEATRPWHEADYAQLCVKDEVARGADESKLGHWTAWRRPDPRLVLLDEIIASAALASMVDNPSGLLDYLKARREQIASEP